MTGGENKLSHYIIMDIINTSVKTSKKLLRNSSKTFTMFEKVVGKQMKFIMNKPVLFGILTLFLALYAPRLHPKVPPILRELLNSPLFRFLVLVLIIYMSNRDLTMALIISIAFILVISLTNTLEAYEYFTEETFSNYETFTDTEEEEENTTK